MLSSGNAQNTMLSQVWRGENSVPVRGSSKIQSFNALHRHGDTNALHSDSSDLRHLCNVTLIPLFHHRIRMLRHKNPE